MKMIKQCFTDLSKSEKKSEKKRYEVNIGKFGCYYYDNKKNKELPIEHVANLLNNRNELIKAAKIGANWLQHWLDEDECCCDGTHICGRYQKQRELDRMNHVISEYK